MSTDRHHTEDTPLHGHWLILARLLWTAIFLLTLAVFCANLLTGNYGLVLTILVVVATSVWFAVSLVLFWRKSTDRTVLLFSLLLVLTGGFYFPPLPLALQHVGAWWLPIDVLGVLGGAGLSFVYTFPDGRFIPSFTRWLALGWITFSLVPVPIPGNVYPWNWWLFPPYTLVRLAVYGSLAFALLYRYRLRSTAVQRQQIKWVVFAATILIGDVSVDLLVGQVLPYFFPALGLSLQLRQLVRSIALDLVPVIMPLAIGIALLRYRLWDIDTIINKALVYGLLTGLLGACYVGLILGLESLGVALNGTTNQPIALVLSTVVIAALFLPVRRRIQNLIDRRFYRRKYDAEQTLAAFSATLRNEVDLEQIRHHLLTVVQETMQPAHVSLWLRPPLTRQTTQPAQRLELYGQKSPDQARPEYLRELEE